MRAEELNPLCTGCKHSTPRYSNITFCTHPDNLVVSKVDGVTEFDRSCDNLRGNKDKCGVEAKWWEAK